MHKLAALALAGGVILGTSTLSGCEPGNNTAGATVTGAAAGGLLGAALFRGNSAWIGVAGGAILGGMLGNRVGQYMDRQDEANMRHAVTSLPVGEEARWTNAKNVTYVVRPVRVYRAHKRYCREYTTRVNIGGRWQSAHGTACRMPDGSWKIKK